MEPPPRWSGASGGRGPGALVPRGMMHRSIAAHNAAMVALARLVHPAPAIAVTLLAAVLAILLGSETGAIDGWRVALVVTAVAGSQVATGALNDWADRNRDAAAGRPKPIAEGLVSPATALALGGAGIALQLAASAFMGAPFALLGLVALGSAVGYDLWLSRTPASVVPYVVSFGTLPLWIASGVAVPPARVAGAVPLAALFAAAAHLANTLRDYESDRATGSRALAQLLGRAATRWIALALGIAVWHRCRGGAGARRAPVPGGGGERRHRSRGRRRGRGPRGVAVARPARGRRRVDRRLGSQRPDMTRAPSRAPYRSSRSGVLVRWCRRAPSPRHRPPRSA